LLRHLARWWHCPGSAGRTRRGDPELRGRSRQARGGRSVRAHVAAIKALIPAPYVTYFVDVPEAPTYPYVLLWTSAGAPGIETSLCDANRDLDASLGVTHVATSPEGALITTERIRGALQPGGGILRLNVPGRAAWLKRFDSRDVQVDRDVTLPAPNRHPAFAVDLYRLTSTP